MDSKKNLNFSVRLASYWMYCSVSVTIKNVNVNVDVMVLKFQKKRKSSRGKHTTE